MIRDTAVAVLQPDFSVDSNTALNLQPAVPHQRANSSVVTNQGPREDAESLPLAGPSPTALSSRCMSGNSNH